MIDYKKQLKQIFWGLSLVILFGIIIWYFKLSVHQCVLMFLAAYFFKIAYLWYVSGEKIVATEVAKNVLLIFVFTYGIYYLSKWGWLGGIGILIVAALYILLTKRKEFISAKQEIERQIWGKPLKEFIAEKEKPPKLVFTWK